MMSKECEVCGAKPEHQTKIPALKKDVRDYPIERGLPMSHGPWRVIPSEKHPPYKFAVVGKTDVAVAYTHGQETADRYAEQMNEKGYIEVY